MELEKERIGLDRMQIEIKAIQLPIPDGGIEVLSKEIEKLRQDCDRMSQEVEEAGPSYGEHNLYTFYYLSIIILHYAFMHIRFVAQHLARRMKLFMKTFIRVNIAMH